jgi:hypothetical protein
MVITRIPASELVDLPHEKASKICGYIEVDQGAEILLKREEDPTHYGFKRTATAFGHGIVAEIRRYLAQQLREFAEAKLGLGAVERPAGFYELLRKFNALLQRLGLLPSYTGHGRGGRRPPIPPKDLGVIIRPHFPRSYLRVDVGEEARFNLEVVNRTNSRLKATVEAWTEQAGSRIWTLDPQNVVVGAGKRELLEEKGFTIEAGRYAQGACKLFAKLKCLEHPAHSLGEELDTAVLIFWINQDPQWLGWPISEILHVTSLEEEYKGQRFQRQFSVEPRREGGYCLKINTGHPLWAKRATTPAEAQEYTKEILARATPLILAMEGQEPFRGNVVSGEAVKRSLNLSSLILEHLSR